MQIQWRPVMRIRGSMYRDWEDSQLECVTHEEAVESGSIIEVQARLSSAGDTQLFIGVYSSEGVAVI
jgi:hypothetical protein